jgi:hypothetical protein
VLFQPCIKGAKAGIPTSESPILMYCQRFDAKAIQSPGGERRYEPSQNSGLYRLRRAIYSGSDERVGDIVPVTQIRTDVEVAAAFGAKIPSGINCYNALETLKDFNLNHFCSREVFYRFHVLD